MRLPYSRLLYGHLNSDLKEYSLTHYQKYTMLKTCYVIFKNLTVHNTKDIFSHIKLRKISWHL